MIKLFLLISLTISTQAISLQNELLSKIEITNAKQTDSTIISSFESNFNSVLLKSEIDFLKMQLPNNESILLQRKNIKFKSTNKYSWFGEVAGATETSVSFAVVNQSISGSIFTPRSVFEIIPLGNNKVRVVELQLDNMDECDGELYPEDVLTDLSMHKHVKKFTPSFNGVDEKIDVLIFYTNDTLVELGSHDAVEALAQAGVDNMNTSFSNSTLLSGIGEVNLVATLPIDRDEAGTGSSSTEINWLMANFEAYQLRNALGADMVSMITVNTGCGLGLTMRDPGSSFSEFAYSIVRHNCAVSNLSIAHEFGHNLGLEHNPENTGTIPENASFPYSYGQYHSGEYRTVMSYFSECDVYCPRKMYYSNPDVSYLGLPSGVVDVKDNARTLEQTTPIVMDFRNHVELLIFKNGFEL